MSRLAKFLLPLLLIPIILACGVGSQPLNTAQEPTSTPIVLASVPPTEAIEPTGTEVQTETNGNNPEYDAMLDPKDAPVAEWNGIPVMPQATVGQAFDLDRYSFKATASSEEAQGFYRDELSKLGWTESFSLPSENGAGSVIGFEKEASILTITFTSMDGYLLVILYIS